VGHGFLVLGEALTLEAVERSGEAVVLIAIVMRSVPEGLHSGTTSRVNRKLTKGNPSSHLAKLEEAGYVEIEKTYRGKIPMDGLPPHQEGLEHRSRSMRLHCEGHCLIPRTAPLERADKPS
jgi:DNA-binding transcriptional ArsR family regulator